MTTSAARHPLTGAHKRAPVAPTAPTNRIQIATRYVGPTDTKGSRITAVVRTGEYKGRRVTVPYAHDTHDAHVVAVVVLTSKLGLFGAIDYAGTTNTGNVYNVAV